MPRNDAADRYSPDTAAALKRGRDPRGRRRGSPRSCASRPPRGRRSAAWPARRGRRRGRSRAVPGPLGDGSSAESPRSPRPPRGAAATTPGRRAPARAAPRRPARRRGTPSSADVVQRGGQVEQQRQAHEERGSRRAAPSPPAAAAARRILLGPLQLGGRQPGRADRRTVAPGERERVCGLVTATARRPPALPDTGAPPQRAPCAHRPSRRAPGSNTPRVAASSSRSRSSRAWRRLTGTSPTSVCASSPPLTSLRSSCTACTASR